MGTLNVNDDLPMPMEKMPDSWFKDDQMNAMFAEFRNRSVNPQDWDSKYNFWVDLITNWLSHNKQCTFSILHLTSVFKRKGRSPLCLPTVINELYKKGEIMIEDQFLNDHMTTWTSWAVNTMVKRPVIWSFSKLKNYFIPNVTFNHDLKYIHLKTVEELANVILSLNDNGKELILSLREITIRCNEKLGCKNITEDSVKLALLWIGRLKNSGFNSIRNYREKNSDCLFKIHTNEIEELSEADENLFKLKESERTLLEKIESLEIERNELTIKAKSSLSSGLREVAKTHVRKKRELEKRIEKYASTLQNLHVIISNIHDAHSNTEVLAAYKRGSGILKSFEKEGLNEFTVRDTMDDITEILGDMSEIQTALTQTLNINDTDLELEEELNELLNNHLHDEPVPSVPDSKLSELEKEIETLSVIDPPQLPKTSHQSADYPKKLVINNQL
ncbi:hypothetical protein PV327_006333 [Microctonus hyperodae]|uniref:Charged multivesicular body protein 7 n=1 Tax=Microctonus hyperodae TaxID=165561 RepID=A0AA39KI33_MICHY|nr:hypothetical protein PV327_006333 [Microctonus hyperodae]